MCCEAANSWLPGRETYVIMRKLFLILWSVATLAGAATLALVTPNDSDGLYATLSHTV